MYYCGLKSVGINKNIKLFRPFFAMKFIFEKPFNVEILRSTEASIFFVIAYWNIKSFIQQNVQIVDSDS